MFSGRLGLGIGVLVVLHLSFFPSLVARFVSDKFCVARVRVIISWYPRKAFRNPPEGSLFPRPPSTFFDDAHQELRSVVSFLSRVEGIEAEEDFEKEADDVRSAGESWGEREEAKDDSVKFSLARLPDRRKGEPLAIMRRNGMLTGLWCEKACEGVIECKKSEKACKVLSNRLKDRDTDSSNLELKEPRFLPENELVYEYPVRLKMRLCRKRPSPEGSLSRPFDESLPKRLLPVEDISLLPALLELLGSNSGSKEDDGDASVPSPQPVEVPASGAPKSMSRFYVIFALCMAIGAFTSLACTSFFVAAAIAASRKAQLDVA